MDTSSSVIAQALHMLAKHSEAQEKLCKELRDARNFKEDIPYDKLSLLPYLDPVHQENQTLA